MKCTKCGYFSFDHLSECKKCGTNLSGVRDALGFSAAKPSIPFFLGSLLKDYQQPASMDSPTAETASAVAPAFDFGDETEIGGGYRLVMPESDVEMAAETVPNPEEGEEDFSLLDLSDEELELLIDKNASVPAEGKGAEAPLEIETEKAPAGEFELAMDEGPVTEKISVAKEEDWVPKFDIESLPGLATKPPEAEEPVAPESATPAPQEENAPDDFVIELSDKDLQALMLELDSAPRKEGAEDEETETVPPEKK
ncbi:MAG: hypothetical protein LLG06_02810 [Desulfobacteraceae bacterium]|nr:hypothetical protein [Desulfobacteraceae bacterium]